MKPSSVFFLLFLISFLFTACNEDKEDNAAEARNIEMQKILTQAKADTKAPAIVTAMASPSRNWEWSGAAGIANLSTGEKATVSHKFRTASVTKMVTAAAVMLLVEDNKIKLSDKISTHLPTNLMREINEKVPDAAQITVEHLLNHTSSFADYTATTEFGSLAFSDPTSSPTPEQVISIGLDNSPVGKIGDHNYSNVNYNLLGIIIEQVSGKPYRTFAKERILSPLGMTNSYFPNDETISLPYLAQHVNLNDPSGNVFDVSFYNHNWAIATGDLITSVEDLQKFLQALLEGRLVSTQSLNTMKNRTTAPGVFGLSTAKYGLGMIINDAEPGFIGHGGDLIGIHTQAFYFNDIDTYIVCVYNGDDNKGLEFILAVYDSILLEDQ